MRLILLSILIILPFFVQAQTDACLANCPKYQTALTAGKSYIDTKPKRYSKAIFEFLAAETAARECNCNSDEINGYIRQAIDGLEAEKEAAIAAELRAEAEARAAKRAEDNATQKAQQLEVAKAKLQTTLETAERERKRAENALEKLQIEQEKTAKAKQTLEVVIDTLEIQKTKTNVALEQTNELNIKNEKLIKAFYFYDDKYALAYNQQGFYFINKDGEAISKLGKWDKAENFSPTTGLAKVVPSGMKYSQYIDTLNNKYPIAYRIPFRDKKKFYKAYEVKFNKRRFCFPKRILKNDEIVLLELRGSKIKKMPDKIGNLKDLKVLDFSNNQLKTLPETVGQLSNLTLLNLSYNQLSTLPESIKQLNNLKKIILVGNRFSDTERQKIEGWLPNCQIEW